MFYFRLNVFTRNVFLIRWTDRFFVIFIDWYVWNFSAGRTSFSKERCRIGTYIVSVYLRVVLRAYLVLLLIAELSVCTTPGLLFKCLKPFVGCMSCVVLCRAVPLCRVCKILHTGTVTLNFILYFQQTAYFLSCYESATIIYSTCMVHVCSRLN